MTPDQAELLKLAEESIGAAKLLLDNDYQGFAASRAYYAMFSAAEALLLSKGLSFSKHSAVKRHSESSSSKAAWSLPNCTASFSPPKPTAMPVTMAVRDVFRGNRPKPTLRTRRNSCAPS